MIGKNMKKVFTTLTLLTISAFAAEKNIGFLMNQKYVCTNQGAIIDGKIVPVMSQEDALQHPLRFFVDGNNLLQTDGSIKNLKHIEKTTYGDFENKIMLTINDNKRYIFMSSKKMKNIPIVYVCVETNNWTLAK